MLTLFLILTGLSLVTLVAGIVWTLVVGGETRRQRDPAAFRIAVRPAGH